MLVSAGPTREYIDPVRYLSNESSGRMGYAIAREGHKRGHDVVLVTGPTCLRPPSGPEVVSVTSAREMEGALAERFDDADCLVMAAAVADYRPRRRSARKIAKEDMPGGIPVVRNPDIVARLGRRKERRVVVGFALETDHGEERARRKMRAKNLDWVVLNGPEALGARSATVHILGTDGASKTLSGRTKEAIARAVVRAAEETFERDRREDAERSGTGTRGSRREPRARHRDTR